MEIKQTIFVHKNKWVAIINLKLGEFRRYFGQKQREGTLKLCSYSNALLIRYIPKIIKSNSANKGIKGPSFTNIKTTLYKNINKLIPSDINNFNEMPDDSIYYHTLNNQFLRIIE